MTFTPKRGSASKNLQSRSQRSRSFCTATGITPLDKSNGGSGDEIEEPPKREVNKPPACIYVYFSVLDFHRTPCERTIAGGSYADSAPVAYLPIRG